MKKRDIHRLQKKAASLTSQINKLRPQQNPTFQKALTNAAIAAEHAASELFYLEGLMDRPRHG